MNDFSQQSEYEMANRLTSINIAALMWQRRGLVLFIWLGSAIASVVYALSLSNVYKSEAVMVAAIDTGSMGLSGQIGSLAAMAGINIGKDKPGDKSELAVQLLKSRDFVTEFLVRHQLAVDLMAVKSWDPITDKIEYDADIYVHNKKLWTREVEPPFMPEPSPQTLYKEFEKIFTADKDKLTGLIKVSLEHPSPKIAQQWLNQIITDVNEEIRRRDIEEANRSLNYLQKKVEETNIIELRTLFYSLIEDQTKTLLLANVKKEYALKMIDPPFVAEEKSSPRRAVLVVFLTFAGVLFSVLIVLLEPKLYELRRLLNASRKS
ncbi:MAG: LPS O-antigen length regulator [Burkholderiaceae bacterium]|nr:MAG: LPS O-antigen length regulator [Burkholderiaceae bacterium]